MYTRVCDETAETTSEADAWSREAGNSPPGSSEEGALLSTSGRVRLQSRARDGRETGLDVPHERGVSEVRRRCLVAHLSVLRLLVAQLLVRTLSGHELQRHPVDAVP